MTRRAVRASWMALAVVSFGYAITLWIATARGLPVLGESATTGGLITVAWLFFLVASGLLVRRQPWRWSGPLVLVAALFPGGFAAARFGLGAASPAVGAVWLATILVPATLMLAHPDGVNIAWVRRLFIGGLGLTAALAVAVVLTAHGAAGASTAWWATPARQAALPLAQHLFAAHTVVVVATLSMVVVVSVLRLTRADRALRRLLRPVVVPGVVWAFAVGACQLASLHAPWWALGHETSLFSAPATFVLLIAPLVAGVAMTTGVVWADLIVPRLQRTTAGVAIGSDTGATGVTEYLAAALADPSVQVAFRRPDADAVDAADDEAGVDAGVAARVDGDDAWVDAAGRPTSLAFDDPDRAVMVLRREGFELGAIEFDASLASEPDAVELAVTAAALAMDNARLLALANSRTEDARLLTARLVTSADAARDQLYDQLAEPLRQLQDLAIALSDTAAGDNPSVPAEAADRLQHIAATVRRISHGLFPPQLTDGGLAAALPLAAVVPSRRFAAAIEITAFMAAEGDQGAALVADEPGVLTINLSEPPRRRALLDRVAVLGGTIRGATITLPVTG